MKIIVEVIVTAPIEKVWHIYTSPQHIIKWNSPSDDWHTTSSSVDLRVGGKFSSRMEAKDGSLGFDFAGTYTKLIVNQLIEYTFDKRTAKIEFLEVFHGIKLIVEFESESTHSIEQQQQGWQAILNNFKFYVENTKNI